MTDTERALTKKRILLFVIITFIIAWLTFLSIPFFGLKSGSITVVVILACAMFAPTIGNLLTRVITKEGFHGMYLRPHLKGNIRLYLLVFFGPTVLLLLSGVFYFLVFPHSFDPELSTLNQFMDPSGAGKVTANSMFVVSLVQFILLGPIINLIPTLGEELGWRGYLLPKLREFFKTRTALIISGAVWGIWHAPIIAQGHNYGTEYLGFPWLGILAMVVFCLSLGIIEGYISIRLNSAIPRRDDTFGGKRRSRAAKLYD